MVDYSKWSNLDDDSEEEEEQSSRPRITRLETGSSVTFGGGKTGAQGAAPIEVKAPAPSAKPPAVVQPKRAASTTAAVASSKPTPPKVTKTAPPPKGSLADSYAKWDAILADESDSDDVSLVKANISCILCEHISRHVDTTHVTEQVH
jgi:hypothetical protein